MNILEDYNFQNKYLTQIPHTFINYFVFEHFNFVKDVFNKKVQINKEKQILYLGNKHLIYYI